jgi:predicted AlkP superfamily phosphohydrolase/phosphomutase
MIGLDAAELSFIRGSLSTLPTLRRILECGRLDRLDSTAGVFPGSVWPTFYSGMLPGDHGIYHHLQWDSDAMRLRRVTDDWLFVEPFWHELERRGLRVAAIDVPMSFPSRLAGGVEIINWGSHDELGPYRVHPRHLADEIRRRFGRHPMGSEIPVRKSSAQLTRIRRNLVAGARLKGALINWLLASSDWDFFLAVFGETHRGGHILWPEQDPGESAVDGLLEVYQAVDQALGQLLQPAVMDQTTLILFALHGMGFNQSQEHFIPKVMDRVNLGFLGTGASIPARDRPDIAPQRSAMRLLRERVPAGLQNLVARAVPVEIRDFVVSRQISAGHDWRRTPAIALLADLNGYLRWNLKGRESQGLLEQDGEPLERYISWVRRCLMGLRTPGGASLVREVLLTARHFSGNRAGLLPDAVVQWTSLPPGSQAFSDEIGGVTAEPSTGRSGNHRAEGFCITVESLEARERRIPPPHHIVDLSRYVSEHLHPSV